jgi:hypothetical protein
MQNAMTDVDAIRRILVDEWDPIGCGVADDEYDAYIPMLYHMMRSGVSLDELSDRLCRIETQQIGMTLYDGMKERNDGIAALLLDVVRRR